MGGRTAEVGKVTRVQDKLRICLKEREVAACQIILHSLGAHTNTLSRTQLYLWPVFQSIMSREPKYLWRNIESDAVCMHNLPVSNPE